MTADSKEEGREDRKRPGSSHPLGSISAQMCEKPTRFPTSHQALNRTRTRLAPVQTVNLVQNKTRSGSARSPEGD